MASHSYMFEKDMRAKLRRAFGAPPTFAEKWFGPPAAQVVVLWLLIVYVMIHVPNRVFDPAVIQITYTIGMLAVWRFGWWFNHAVRAEVFAGIHFPKQRLAAERAWNRGWRPRHMHFMITTFYEKPEITRKVLQSVTDNIRESGVDATIWFGTGSSYDERVIREFIETHARDLSGSVRMVRQNQPGKRMAIGIVMRAIIRSGAHPEDIIMFMDGDSVLDRGAVRKCASYFGADPELEALTTNEGVIVYGPRWMQSWLNMRFAQRRLAMQSHALSGRVLTLTGRMSVFRARQILNLEFVRTVEADHLDHWLWGRFRFLSGDDKSTWFHLLKRGAKMTYVPDVLVMTVEVIEGSGRKRMVQNLRRWSGNMLRNGARAISLGPRRMPLFIWLCLVDQRVAMWTMMVSPLMIIYAMFFIPSYAVTAICWIILVRCALALVLYRHAERLDASWVFLLYINQVLNAVVKVFMLFHLSQQAWANRGNQRAGYRSGMRQTLKQWVANFQMITIVAAFIWVVVWIVGEGV